MTQKADAVQKSLDVTTAEYVEEHTLRVAADNYAQTMHSSLGDKEKDTSARMNDHGRAVAAQWAEYHKNEFQAFKG